MQTQDPTQLRIFAALLALPEDDAIDAVRDMQGLAPWLEPCLAELEQIPLDHWQAEHTRLMISGYPKTPCPPYQSAYLQGTMGGTAARDLAGLYRRAGLQTAEVPADYLGTMLECAAYLQEQGMDDLFSELTDKHLARWLPRFARDLTENAKLRLYHLLGDRLGQLIPPRDDE